MNYLGDDLQFYPTPDWLVDKMLDKCGEALKSNNTRVLEPSAGDGRIVEAIKQKLKIRWLEKVEIECVEIDPNRQLLLKGKGFNVVDSDFLQYKPFVRYDLVVMNPPFAKAERHIAHALGMLKEGGRLVALCNAETIRNPFSRERKALLEKLNRLGVEIQYFENAFVDADHEANVDVALLSLTMPKKRRESYFWQGMQQAREAEHKESEPTALAFADFPDNYIQAYQMEAEVGLAFLREYEALAPYIMTGKSTYAEPTIKLKIGDSDYNVGEREYLTVLRRKYWNLLMSDSDILSRCSSQMAQDYRDKVCELYSSEFNHYNIQKLILDINAALGKGVEKTIMDLFETFTQEHAYFDGSKNIHYYNGWKTNKAHKVGTKVIIPCYGVWSPYSFDKKDKIYAHEATTFFKDIEMALNYLSGNMEPLSTGKIMRTVEDTKQTRNIHLRYFDVTFYKKGTAHLKFHDEKVLERLNIFAAQNRTWLPPSYGKARYEDMDKEAQDVIDSFQGKKRYSELLADGTITRLHGSNTKNLLNA